MRNNKITKRVLIGFGVLLAIIIIVSIVGAVSKEKIVKKEDDVTEEEVIQREINKKVVEKDGEEIEMTEDEQEINKFMNEYYLTKEEEDTILNNYVEDYIEPYKQDERVYLFYDRDKVGMVVAVEKLEEYVEDTDVPYTIYLMNSEEGIVQGTEVLKEMGYDYEYGDPEGAMMVQTKGKENFEYISTKDIDKKDLRGD